MYLLLKLAIFHCHVSFRGGVRENIKIFSQYLGLELKAIYFCFLLQKAAEITSFPEGTSSAKFDFFVFHVDLCLSRNLF